MIVWINTKSKATKATMNKCDYIKIMWFYTTHTHKIKKIKSQPMEWQKIFTNHISDKGLMGCLSGQSPTIVNISRMICAALM